MRFVPRPYQRDLDKLIEENNKDGIIRPVFISWCRRLTYI